jgi:glyoxylase-like metal-dependent hydrolase (beta-lactamase superfamily II)
LIWVPHVEQDLFAEVAAHWQARPIYVNYDNRQDRFSLLEPVSIAGRLRDYAVEEFAGIRFTVLPTPGHTNGSITLLAGSTGTGSLFRRSDRCAGQGLVAGATQ